MKSQVLFPDESATTAWQAAANGSGFWGYADGRTYGTDVFFSGVEIELENFVLQATGVTMPDLNGTWQLEIQDKDHVWPLLDTNVYCGKQIGTIPEYDDSPVWLCCYFDITHPVNDAYAFNQDFDLSNGWAETSIAGIKNEVLQPLYLQQRFGQGLFFGGGLFVYIPSSNTLVAQIDFQWRSEDENIFQNGWYTGWYSDMGGDNHGRISSFSIYKT